MSHDIINNEMMSVGQSAWHQQGTTLDHVPTSAEALKVAKLNWEVKGLRNYILGTRFPLTSPENEPMPTQSISLVRHEDTVNSHGAVLREYIILGTVTDSYQIVQNHEAFGLMDKYLINEGYTYETAGAIRRGEIVWILAKRDGGQEVIEGDRIDPYVLLVTGHDGKHKVSVTSTPIRVVCWNTLTIALRRGYRSTVSVEHSKNVMKNLNNFMELLKNKPFNEAMIVFKEMAATPVTLRGAIMYFENVIPDLTKRDDPELRRNVWTRMFHQLTSNFASGRGNKGKTVWDAYNAITEYVDHTRFSDDRNTDGRLNYSQFGMGALIKQRAMTVAEGW